LGRRRDTHILFTLTVIVGGVSGLAAVAFHQSIDILNDRLLDPILATSLATRIVLLPVLLVVVGAIVGLLLQRVVPFARGSGIPEVKTAYVFGPGEQLSLRTVVGKFVLAALSIGAGFSLGREGPTVQICAAIAAAVGKAARQPARIIKALISVGAAAGIAAAFNTPIAAITFAMEEVIGDLDHQLVGAIVVASVAAAVVERAILGGRPSLLVPNYSLGDWRELFAYALLGGAAGLAAVGFVRSVLELRRFVRHRVSLPSWAKPAIGGSVMAAIGLLLPRTLGIGYPTLSEALLGGLSWRSMTALGVGKIAATVTSYGWGLSGGIFSPALFMGAMVGGVVAHVVHPFNGPTAETVGSFALVGMGAFFAGAIRAPITSILIIFEMTGDYAIILPLMISNMISYTIAARLQPTPIYDALLEQDEVPMPKHNARLDLRTMTVEQAMRPAEVPIALNGPALFADQSLDLALLEFGRRSIREAPVVRRASPNDAIGMLSLEDISASVTERDE
jgi:CIC family chloride channel protein